MARPSELISRYLQSEIAGGSFPSAQYVVGENHEIVAEDALGWAVVEPERIEATMDTIYDLASLTKPLVTALLVVKLAERGVIDLKAPVGHYLSEFANSRTTGARPLSVTHLMTHTSGLPNWRPLYMEAKSAADVPAVIARTLDGMPPLRSETELVYSDLNYVLLGFLVERVTGERLDRLAHKEIFAPLELKRTMFNPPPEMKRDTAATERGQQFEQSNALAEQRAMSSKQSAASAEAEPAAYDQLDGAPRSSWRTGIIWGEVHDGNSHFLGGVAGHAGLFSTAREIFRLVNQFLPGSKIVSPDYQRLFTQNFTRGRDTDRTIAWILASTEGCSAGPSLPPTGIGHNGFTGTSIWMDPGRMRVMILFTNRVHPKVDAIDMRRVRQRFNSLAVETLDLRANTK
jgi:CubicO group peptidase (beta-lactamase class C family)